MDVTNKIKFALYLKGWSFLDGDKVHLRKVAQKIFPLEFLPEMKGNVFCHECSAPLFRSPEDKDYATNGRKAFYAHARGTQTDCSLRVKQAEGKRYENEEEARSAIEDGELVIVQTFMKEKPTPLQVNGHLVYDKEPNEDKDGQLTLAAIGRHNGEEFKLPSKVTTVRGLCKSFENNLNKYFLLPGNQVARSLRELLGRVDDIKETCDIPGLYVGRITYSVNMGPNSWNIRQTFLRFPNGYGFKDFCLKATDEASREHGIDDDSKGRVVIVYGKIRESGLLKFNTSGTQVYDFIRNGV